MDLIQQINGRLSGWVNKFNTKNLLDKKGTCFVTINSFNNKSQFVSVAADQINPKNHPVFIEYDDGMILDKESTTLIVKISRPDQKSPDEEIFIVTVVAESKHDSNMIANHVTQCLIEFLQETGKLKFAA